MFTINTPKNKPLCIYGVIRPLYIVARLFGFFPFSMKTESNGQSRIHFTFIDFVVFVVQVLIYSYFAYVNIFYNLMENTEASTLLVLGMRIGLIFGLANAVAFLFGDLCNRHRIFDIFNLCQNFDYQVRLKWVYQRKMLEQKLFQMQLLGLTVNHKQNKQCIYMYFLAWILIFCVYGSISFWIFRDLFGADALIVSFISFYLWTSVFGIVLTIYSFFLFSVRARYSLLNNALR